MSEILTAAFLVPLFTAGVRMSVPLIFGSVGDVVSERSGVMNIGLEGEMLVSALISFMAAYHTGSLFIGILAGGMAGLAGALLIAFWGVSRKQDQSVVGIMFNIFALGFTNFLYRAVYGVSTDKIKVDILKNIEIPLLSKIPFIGDIFFKHNLLVYCAFAAAAVVWFLLRYTNLGLKVNAAGENPKAAAAAGIDVVKIRYKTYMFSGFMAGIGGAAVLLAHLRKTCPRAAASSVWPLPSLPDGIRCLRFARPLCLEPWKPCSCGFRPWAPPFHISFSWPCPMG